MPWVNIKFDFLHHPRLLSHTGLTLKKHMFYSFVARGLLVFHHISAGLQEAMFLDAQL
jgi:hypothetical protein